MTLPPHIPAAPPRRRGPSPLRRRLIAWVPAAVWLLAIAAAVFLARRGAVSGSLMGAADHQSVTISHPDAGVVREVHVELFQHVAAGQVLLSLDDGKGQVTLHDVRASVNGQVTSLSAVPGDHVPPGSPLVVISPESTSHVVAYVPESLIGAVQVGRAVTVHRAAATAADQRGRPGTIVRLSAVVAEAPHRFRAIPTRPVWGRGMVVALDGGMTLIPGEAVTIELSRQR